MEETKKTKRLKANEGTKIEIELPDTDEMDNTDHRIDINDFEFRMKHDIQANAKLYFCLLPPTSSVLDITILFNSYNSNSTLSDSV